jgi:outer membrane protein assembly factor BamE (lipoprotein component of BamABCDE complex)
MGDSFMRTLLTLSLCIFTSACFTQVGVTNRLTPGMSADQVRSQMGEPSQTQFIADKIVWKYSLHQPWKGFIPYYLVFNKDTQVLEQWAANEAEFARQQQHILQTWSMLNQTFPPTQRREVEVKIKRK